MSTLSTNKMMYVARGDSLKAIRLASSLGGPSFAFLSTDTSTGLVGNAIGASNRMSHSKVVSDTAEQQAVAGANLSLLRNGVAAAIIASTAMIHCDSATATEPPEVHQLARQAVAPVKQQEEMDDILDPLVFHWDQEKYIVSEAIRSYVAQFDADN